jgi:hypothetical protein
MQGGNLSRTLFASKLTLEVMNIQDSELCLAIKAIMKTCSLMHRFIMSARVFEDDDFISDTYQFDLMDTEMAETLMNDLEEASQKVLEHKDDHSSMWAAHFIFLKVIDRPLFN